MKGGANHNESFSKPSIGHSFWSIRISWLCWNDTAGRFERNRKDFFRIISLG